MSELVDNFLAHYASPNYDPAKAHEYYLKTRELKGRTSTKGFSDTQKEAWAYAQNKIGNDKKAEQTQAQNDQKARLEALRSQADAARARIRESLQTFADKFKTNAPTLHEIPVDASPQLKASLQRQNDQLLKQYQAQKATARTALSKAASEQLKKVGEELHNALTKAQTDYAAATKERDARYKAMSDQELQNIKTQLPGRAPKPKKPKAAPKGRKPRQPGQHRAPSKSQQQIEQLQAQVAELQKGR